jgi:hypothetical protein
MALEGTSHWLAVKMGAAPPICEGAGLEVLACNKPAQIPKNKVKTRTLEHHKGAAPKALTAQFD